MKFQKKAVIFDLDGVICFTDKFHYLAWKALADRLGIYFDEKINDRLRGVSRMASLEIILERATKEYTQAEKEAFAEEKNNTYRELLKNMSPKDLTDEVRDTLNELRARGYKLSIGSSSKNTKFILGQIGLGDFFDAIADGTDRHPSRQGRRHDRSGSVWRRQGLRRGGLRPQGLLRPAEHSVSGGGTFHETLWVWHRYRRHRHQAGPV